MPVVEVEKDNELDSDDNPSNISSPQSCDRETHTTSDRDTGLHDYHIMYITIIKGVGLIN